METLCFMGLMTTVGIYVDVWPLICKVQKKEINDTWGYELKWPANFNVENKASFA